MHSVENLLESQPVSGVLDSIAGQAPLITKWYFKNVR